MKGRPPNSTPSYEDALRAHLKQGPKANSDLARGLWSEALAGGPSILDLAKLHERTMVLELLPSCPVRDRAALIRQAGGFFAVAVAPAKNSDPGWRQAPRLKEIILTLSQRTAERAAAHAQLSLEIARRKAAETALKKARPSLAESPEQSDSLKEELRGLSRELLSTQEDDRTKISRELHDVIAQSLIGINIRLATLKKETGINTKELGRDIAVTQRLVTKSVNVVYQFARDLHPSVLDDLGLIPALHSLMKIFMERTGVRPNLTVFAGVEKLDSSHRTLLYRIAEEALTNVGLHAHATCLDVDLRKRAGNVCMTIRDDGRAFDVPAATLAHDRKHTGLHGMRERLEAAGGSFHIESSHGKGTLITALIPARNARKKSRA